MKEVFEQIRKIIIERLVFNTKRHHERNSKDTMWHVYHGCLLEDKEILQEITRIEVAVLRTLEKGDGKND